MTFLCDAHSRWEKFSSMQSPRVFHELAWLPYGRLFAVGGRDGDDKEMATVEMLTCFWGSEDPVKSEWKYMAPLLKPRSIFGMAYFDTKLIVAGGWESDTVEYLTPPIAESPDGQWTAVRPIERKLNIAGLLPFGDALLSVGK